MAGVLALAGGGLLFLPRLCRTKRLRAYLLLITLSMAAGFLYGWAWSRLVADPVREKCGDNHLFSATVCDWPESTDSGWRVTVRLTDAKGAKAVCYLNDDAAAGLEPGQALLGTAYWQDASVIKSKELSTFTARGVFALLYCEEMPSVTPGQAGSLRYLPQRAEKTFREKIARIWADGTVAGLLQAELIGDRSGISQELSNRFSEAGVSHLFAVSGLHCAFLLTLLSLLIGLIIGLYDGLVGPGTGTFLLLLLTGAARMPLNDSAGITKVINLSSNIAALAVYIFSGNVLYPLGLAAGVFSIAGNYLGTRVFTANGSRGVKPIMITVLGIFFIKLCYELFFAK